MKIVDTGLDNDDVLIYFQKFQIVKIMFVFILLNNI